MHSSTTQQSRLMTRNDRREKRAELPENVLKKLKSCSVTNCEDWRDMASYTTYHCFPTGDKNQDRWEIWTQLLRKARDDDSWIPFRGSLVCSHHFRTEDFVNDTLSKRRKLVKNAIPSIFPTFTVDLSDPIFQVSGERGEGADGGNANMFADGNSVMASEEEDDEYEYDFEYQTVEDDDDIQSFMQSQTPIVQHGEDEDEDDEIQIINDPQTPSTTFIRTTPITTVQNSRTVLTSAGCSQVISNSSSAFQKKANQKSSENFGQVSLQSHSISSSSVNKASQQYQGQLQSLKDRNSFSVFNKRNDLRQQTILDRKEETQKALSELPFSLNPDLEIEVVDPVEDLALCRLRVSELEQENRSLITMYENTIESLKEKYESEIKILRKHIADQEELLNQDKSYTMTAFPSLTKKVRFS